ncbi:MAG: pseudouridine synthase [Tahibacter sp.]
MKLLKRIANLGYGSRREVDAMFKDERITSADGSILIATSSIPHEEIRIDGEAVDPAPGMLIALHKPVGYTCSTKDAGRLVYDLLPTRWRARDPILATIGRLDRDTSGLLLLSDDGALQHRITSPRSHLSKVYEAVLAGDLRGDEVTIFSSGTLMLESEKTALLPAEMEMLGPRLARLTLHEGRYHQVRRMFAAVGNHVTALHRTRIGGFVLGDLPSGHWRLLDAEQRARIFAAAADDAHSASHTAALPGDSA